MAVVQEVDALRTRTDVRLLRKEILTYILLGRAPQVRDQLHEPRTEQVYAPLQDVPQVPARQGAYPVARKVHEPKGLST